MMKNTRPFAGWAGIGLLFVVVGCGGGAPAPAAPPSPAAPPPLPPSMSAPSAPEASTGNAKADADVDRATVAIRASDYRSAKAALEQALRKNPKNGTASYYMGVALENLGDKAGAEQRYKDAMTDAPDLAEAAINLGALYLDQSRWDDAVAVTRKALAKRPDDPGLHANLAVALRGKGDKEGAAAEYERAIKVVGDNAELRFGYGTLLVEMGDKPKAATELKAALSSAGSNRALLASIARLLGAAGAFADCVAAFDKAISAGDDAELRVGRGLCRHSLHDEPGAKSDFEGAVKLNAKFLPAHYYLGEWLLSAGQGAQAAKEFDAAHALGPTSPLGKKAKAQADVARKTAKGTK